MEGHAHLGHVTGEVVPERHAPSATDPVDDPIARVGVATDHHVGRRVDDRQVHPWLVVDHAPHLVDGREHVPHRPSHTVDAPCPDDGGELAAELVLIIPLASISRRMASMSVHTPNA